MGSVDETSPERRGISTGSWVAIWMLASLLLHAAPWFDGRRDRDLGLAIEFGAAQAEQALVGEVGEKEIREALGLQYESIPFWKAAWGVGDFLLAPLGVALRVLLTISAIAAAAALTGRPPRFSQYSPIVAAAQGFWLLGLALQVGCQAWWGWTPEISARLWLPQGEVSGVVWSIAGQLDPFAILGWLVILVLAIRRGWAHALTGFPILVSLALAEPIFLGLTDITLQASIRGTVMP